MKPLIKRSVISYLKNPLLWAGLLVVIISVYRCLSPYLSIHYMSENEKMPDEVALYDADIMDGYVPTDDNKRRELWEEEIYRNLRDEKKGFGMTETEADRVIAEIQDMDIKEACNYLKKQYEYSYSGALYAYEDLGLHQGTPEEVNQYIKGKLDQHTFSYYFARKFADFAGLHMGFFATILLAFLFLQDTRKNTYELLHTKPVKAWQYVLGKITGGFLMMAGVLFLLNIIFFVLCEVTAIKSGFPMNPLDFLVNSVLYILPNMLMICCVYAVVALLFKNPLPATPLLLLYMVYSNMMKVTDGIYHAKPLSIMVRFPGDFFETRLPYMANFNQCFLVAASILLALFAVMIWKRRRAY